MPRTKEQLEKENRFLKETILLKNERIDILEKHIKELRGFE